MEPPPRDRFSQAGKASIEAIKQHAIANRIASENFCKQLTYTKGSKGTQYRIQLWYRRFEAFREHSLRADTSQPPTGEQIEKFLSSIVGLTKPTTNAVPSSGWLQSGLQCLLRALYFHHPAFSLSRHDTLRIFTVIDELAHQGKVTRKPSRQRNWAGVFIIRKIATAMLIDALTRGTLNWDVTLSKVTSIVSIAALSVRSGDTLTDRLDEQLLPSLCYQDINLKFVGGQDIEHLVAEVVIRNEKSKKNNPKKTPRVILHSLANGSDNCLCLIKLVLILALRSGNVDGQSIDEVLNKARARSDRTIRWTRPNRFVICSIGPRGAALQPEKAANRLQISRGLVHGGMLAGVTAQLASHDLRRGAARELANLGVEIKGVATEAVAAPLGQPKQLYHRGTASNCVGSIGEDIWSRRVEQDYQDLSGLEVSDTPMVKRRRLTSSEGSALCTKHGLDASDPKRGARVGYKNQKENARAGTEMELNQDDQGFLEQTPSQANVRGRRELATTLQQPVSDDEDGEIDGVDFNEEHKIHPDLHCDPIEFVRRFSRINVSND